MAFKRGDFTALNAFFWSDVDLSPYAGTDSGSTPYSIVLTDGAGKTARGFIGAVGAGETLSGVERLPSNLFNIANFTGDVPTGWGNARGTPLKNTADMEEGDACAQIANPAGNSGVISSGAITTLTLNKLQKISFYLKTKAGAGGYFWDAGANYFPLVVSTADWVQTSKYFTKAATNPNFGLFAATDVTASTNKVLIDNSSLQSVSDPPATGVHIVSAYGGSTRAWNSIESGFNPNTIASAVVSLALNIKAISDYYRRRRSA